MDSSTSLKPSATRIAVICWLHLLFIPVLFAPLAFLAVKLGQHIEPTLPFEIPRSVNPRQDPLGALTLGASVLALLIPCIVLAQFLAIAALRPLFGRDEVLDALTSEPKSMLRGKLGQWMFNLAWPQ